MVENVRGHALRGAISRDLGLLIICMWNGIACIFKAGESNSCAHIHVCINSALTLRSFSRSVYIFLLPSLPFLLSLLYAL